MSNWWADRLARDANGGAPAPPRPIPSNAPAGSPRIVVKPPPKAEDLCPDCGSENYLSATAMTQKRCYDCGYPIVQSGTGLSSAKATGATKRAVQVNTGSYSPSTIIGKVQ